MLMLFVPAGVKIAHIFAHQHHKVCIVGDKVHIHQVDLDCDFHKFSIAHHFQLSEKFVELFQTLSHTRTYNLTYNFFNNHRPLSFSLRGPPTLV